MISDELNPIALILSHSKDLSGLEYCVSMGADPNYILNHNYYPKKSLIRCLYDWGTDLNCLELNTIKELLGQGDIVIFLIEHGLDISNYLYELILDTIKYGIVAEMKYFLNMGADIHFEDDLLLFYASRNEYIECVEILLEWGADVHAQNDSILSG